jgi:putative redox protein
MATDDIPRETSVTVRGSGRGFAQEISARSHRLLADEPVANGGTDTGPTPYDLLLAALGSCASMTVALYARRKEWPLEAVRVRLSHTRIHAVDCAECEAKAGWLDRIDWTLELRGDLDRAQRTRLIEIAQMCPVHRTLRSEVYIRPPVVVDGDEAADGSTRT